MAKSIMHRKEDGTCYLCMRLSHDSSRKETQEHHVVFGKGNRPLSERYGLKVYLCLEHHVTGKMAAHRNREVRIMLEAEAQKVFKRAHPSLDFREIFGVDRLGEDAAGQQASDREEEGPGFWFVQGREEDKEET